MNRTTTRRMATLALSMASLVAFPAVGQAATDFGSRMKNDPTDGACKTLIPPCTYAAFIQPSDPNGDPYSGGAPTDGVITKFKIRAYGPGASVTFRLANVTATPNAVSALATAGATGPTVKINGTPDQNNEQPVEVFAARTPVKKGQQLAIDTSTAQAIYNSNGSKFTYVFSGPLQAGAGARGSSDVTNELLVAATIEPDKDRDGFGDETQDRCLTQKTGGPCDNTKPKVGGMKISRHKVVRFNLSEKASVKLSIQKKAGRGYRTVKRLTVNGKAGANKVTLRKALKAGKYRIVASAKDEAGNASRKFTKKLGLK